MDVRNYANGDSKQGRQLLYIVLVAGGFVAILNYFGNRKKTKLEIEKLNMEIQQMEADNKRQHPNG